MKATAEAQSSEPSSQPSAVANSVRRRRWLNRVVMGLIGAGVVAAIVYAMLPQPLPVDFATVARGPLVVTIDEEGKTRVRERYMVSAPLGGQLLRIELDPGDSVVAGETLLTSIEPTDPALLDARSLAEAEARVKRAEKAVEQAGPMRDAAQARYEQSQSEFRRIRELYERNVVTPSEFELAELAERERAEELESAQLAEQIATFELELARAALIRTRPNGEDARIEIRAPIDGRVLRVLQESSAVVTPGLPLVELGDPADLEIEVDVLSSDAVKVSADDRMILEQWGGEAPLQGRVKRIEPHAFTKISALGVEEQRVFIIGEFTDPFEQWNTLGDGYRVEARIVIWEQDDVLKAPIAALFRHEDQWAVFVDRDGRARLQVVEIGQRNSLEAQVLAGLDEGDSVILHPSDEIADGTLVIAR